MKLTYKVEIKPFSVPNYVIPIGRVGHKEDGLKFIESIPLRDIPLKTLQLMCEEFTNSVLMKAGHLSDKESE